MIRIFTKDGIELDLNPDTELEIDMSNPMFEQERISVPFSTTILLPPSPANSETLKYLAAFKSTPQVRELDVEIYDGEVFFFSGKMLFEGIDENGNIEYQFVGSSGIAEPDKSLRDYVNEGRTGKYYPLLVKRDKTGYPEFEEEDGILTETGKYIYTGQSSRQGKPKACMLIREILQRMGVYKVSIYEQTDDIGAIVGKAAVLPFDDDMTVRDFLENTCRLFCCAVFYNTNATAGVEMKDINAILAQDDYLDLSDKVSDIFSSRVESAKGYKLSFANSRPVAESNPNFDDDSLRASRTWGIYDSLSAGVSFLKSTISENVYRPMRITLPEPRDYSIKKTNTKIPYNDRILFKPCILCDLLGYLEDPKVENEINGEQFDASASFNLAECTFAQIPAALSTEDDYYSLLPRVEPADNKGVLIGNLYTDAEGPAQLTDGDVAGTYTGGFVEFAEQMSVRNLYERHHARFAEWLSVDRQVVDVDINLSSQEIANLKIWQKVMFANAFWIAKRITITLSAKYGIVGCRGEFVEL